MPAILTYAAVFLWALVGCSLLRAWMVLIGGGALMAGTAS